jgi:hypothetical protein
MNTKELSDCAGKLIEIAQCALALAEATQRAALEYRKRTTS